MSNGKKAYLSDFLLRQGSSCPLKLWYRIHQHRHSEQYVGYKSETKKMMRRALSLKYPTGKTAADDRTKAFDQTLKWLEQDQVVIHAGVLTHGRLSTRVPIMVKNDDEIAVLQIQGKVWKQSGTQLEDRMFKNRKVVEYLREAAFKKWIINKLRPDLTVTNRICFPNRRFRSRSENLYREVTAQNLDSEVLELDIRDLFIEVPADKAVKILLEEKADFEIHPVFKNMSFSEQLEWLSGFYEKPIRQVSFEVTDACKMCSFRTTEPASGFEGCWPIHLNGDRKFPNRHVYDLIGHGNDREVERKNYFQEQLNPAPGFQSFEQIRTQSNSTITIQQRRSLQILSSGGKEIPGQWLKKTLADKMSSVHYPIHFIDFEAATSAIPMAPGSPPYEPVLFQYSCHTLSRDGNVSHHQWVDCSKEEFPHPDFVRSLMKVPEIDNGTLIQYSPFEKQALNNLRRLFIKNRHQHDPLTKGLNGIINGRGVPANERFLDMNRLVRDYYFNNRMLNGLGLKKVLLSTIETSSYLQEKYSEPITVSDEKFRVVRKNKETWDDPYGIVQSDGEIIDDGSSAMHAYLHTKTPYCGEERRTEIHRSLKRYCSLDSLAMLMIFQHWLNLIEKHGRKELILRN